MCSSDLHDSFSFWLPSHKLTLRSKAADSSSSTSVILLTCTLLSSTTCILMISCSPSTLNFGSAPTVKCPHVHGSSDAWHVTSQKTSQVNPCAQAAPLISPLMVSPLTLFNPLGDGHLKPFELTLEKTLSSYMLFSLVVEPLMIILKHHLLSSFLHLY